MKNNRYIAPVIVTVVMVAYLGLYIWLSATRPDMSAAIRVIAVVLPVIFIAVMIKVLIDRIKEIRKGEDNDLGNY